MKKIILVAIIATTLLSCSENNDDNPTGLGSEILLTQLTINYANNVDFNKQFNYEDSNKLSSTVDSNENREYYTYDGDFISKIEYRNNDQNFFNERFFTYDDSGRLIEEVFLYHHNSVGTRTVFSYQANNTVGYETFSGNLNSQITLSEHGTYALDASGQIIQQNEFSDANGYDRVFTYSYDNKHSPFLNVRDGSNGFKYILNGGVNNIKSHNFTQDGLEIYAYTSDFEYNSNDFPTSEHKNEGGGLTWILYTYNR